MVFVLTPGISLGTTIKIAPNYPEKAVEECIEGWVVIEFSVLPDGTTTEHKVIDSQPKGIFEVSALEAARKLNYSERTEPIEEKVEGVTFKFTYELDEGSLTYAHCKQT